MRCEGLFSSGYCYSDTVDHIIETILHLQNVLHLFILDYWQCYDTESSPKTFPHPYREVPDCGPECSLWFLQLTAS